MSKQLLNSIFDTLNNSKYTWSLYFFKIDWRGNQPYKTYKVRFKNDSYLLSYSQSLIFSVKKYQIDTVSCVQEYDGENTKVTCDKLLLDNDLISNQWEKLYSSIVSSTDKKFDGKLNGYILVGQPVDDNNEAITFVKIANPIINLNNKKSIMFRDDGNDELNIISDDMYRLYLTVDFFVFKNTLYAFNHSFEKLFNLEKTLTKVKAASIEKIIETGCFSDSEEFKTYAETSSARTFISLSNERIEKIKSIEYRRAIASRFNLELDENDMFVIDDKDSALILIKYLCFKIFIDGETDNLLEASTVTKISINQN